MERILLAFYSIEKYISNFIHYVNSEIAGLEHLLINLPCYGTVIVRHPLSLQKMYQQQNKYP